MFSRVWWMLLRWFLHLCGRFELVVWLEPYFNTDRNTAGFQQRCQHAHMYSKCTGFFQYTAVWRRQSTAYISGKAYQESTVSEFWPDVLMHNGWIVMENFAALLRYIMTVVSLSLAVVCPLAFWQSGRVCASKACGSMQNEFPEYFFNIIQVPSRYLVGGLQVWDR